MIAHEWLSRLRNLSIAVVLCWDSSCVWYPVRGYGDQHRGTITDQSLDGLAVGTATRGDVLCALGEPDWASKDETKLVYWCHETTSELIVWLVIDLDGIQYGDDRYLALEFGTDGTLLAMRRSQHAFSQFSGSKDRKPAASDFEALYCTPPPSAANEHRTAAMD